MKQILVWISGIIAVLIFILALEYILGVQWFGFIAPKKENVRREVFKNTRSYHEAKTQDLIKYRLEYMRSNDSSEKEAIASTIRHMYAEYSELNLDPELKDFLHKIKYEVIP